MTQPHTLEDLQARIARLAKFATVRESARQLSMLGYTEAAYALLRMGREIAAK